MTQAPPRPALVAAEIGVLVLLGQVALTASVPFSAAGPGSPGALVVSLVPAGPGTGTLGPGSALPLDLALSNPYDYPVRVTDLTVRVSRVRASRPAQRCGPAAFSTSPGRFTHLDVPPHRSTTLRQAGVPQDQWPAVAMVVPGTDQAVDQGGCRGVTLVLDLHARGRPA